jgi:deoxyribose-phosphate aldolase
MALDDRSPGAGQDRKMLKQAGLDRESVLKMIDNTMLDTAVPVGEIEEFCRRSAFLGFGAVAVNSALVTVACNAVSGTRTKVCSAIAFPLGAVSTFCKIAELRDAIAAGAEELDVVVNINLVKSEQWSRLSMEAGQLVEAADGRVVKLILETSLLTHDEKLRLCDIAVERGVSFVKTSTGFRGGTTTEEIRTLRHRVGNRCGVKATGGIRDLSDVVAMVQAGANRVGTSRGFDIARECSEQD